MQQSQTRKAQKAEWYQLNKTRLLDKTVKLRASDPIAYSQYQAEYRRKNIESARAKSKARYANDEAHKSKVLARVAARRALKRQATPPWFTLEKSSIDAMYLLAAISPGDFHVDHIIPLKNNLVCGLHTLANLQILEGKENRRKNNHWSIT